MNDVERFPAPSPPGPKLRWNWKLFVATWVLLLILAPAAVLFHRWQRVNLATALLKRSETYQAKQDWPNAIAYLERYLLYRSDDTEQQIQLINMYDRITLDAPTKQILVTQYMTAIGKCESDPLLRKRIPELRLAAIKLQMETGSDEDALQQIARLAGPEPDAETERLLALCRYRLSVGNRKDRWDETSLSVAPEWIWPLGAMQPVNLLLLALEHHPGDPELTRALADAILNQPQLLKNSKLAEESQDALKQRLDSALEPVIELHADSPTAWITYIEIALQTSPQKALKAIETAVDKFPNEAAVLMTAGRFYLERAQASPATDPERTSDLSKAESLLEKLRQSEVPLHSKDPLVHMFLGDIELERGNPDNAIARWSEGMQTAYPPTAYLHFRTVKNYLQRRMGDKALAALKLMDEAIRRESINVSESVVEPLLKSSKKLWGAYYIDQKDYVSVAKMLNELAAGSDEQSPSARAEILASLGEACMNASQWDRAGSAYEQALALVPGEAEYRRGAATAWLNANRLSESLKHWQEIPDKTPMDWMQVAVVTLSMQLAGVPEAATWRIFDEAMAQASAADPTDAPPTEASANVRKRERIPPWQLELLSMESQMLRIPPQERATQATAFAQRIAEMCKTSPSIDSLWRQGAQMLRRWNRVEEAERLISDYVENRPDSPLAVVSQARKAAEQGNLAEAQQQLLDRLQQNPDDDSLLQELLLLSEAPAQQAEVLGRLLPWCGNDAMRLTRVCSIAAKLPILDADQEPTEFTRLKKSLELWAAPRIEMENRLRATEGLEGSEWRALKARRLLIQSTVDRTLGLEEIEEIIHNLQVNRPLWATTHVLEGMLSERRLEPQLAIKAYQRAMALGDQSPEMFERLIQLLQSEGMTEEARALIERLIERGIQSQSIAATAIELSLNDPNRLMELAKLGIASRPKDPMAWVWYAQVLDAETRLLNEAARSASMQTIEDAFQRAESLSQGREVRVFNAMYEYFVATGQTSKVADLLERIRTSSALPPNIQWLFLAIAKHAEGDLDLAESYYRLALKSGGNPRDIGRMLSKLLLQQGKLDACIDELETLRKNDPTDARTREAIAIALALRGLQPDWDRMTKLLTDTQNANTPEDRRTLSKLLTQRGLPNDVDQARAILEDLVVDPNQRIDEDSFRLASIYTNQAKTLPDSMQGQSEKLRLTELADQQLKLVAMNSNAKPEHLVTYGNFLLGRGRDRDAAEISKRLTVQAPRSADAMLLRSRVLSETDKQEEAVQFIASWVQTQQATLAENANPALKNQILAQGSNALFAIDAAKEADPWLDTLLQQDSALLLKLLFTMCQSPEPHVHLAAFDRFLEIFAANPSRELAFRVLQLLATNRFQDELMSRAERSLVQFQSDHPDDALFPVYFSDYWIARKQWDRAIEALRTAVQLDPKNVFALNNLANLLGERPESIDEALQHIDQAIAVGGKRPNLLDSKGSILIQAGRFAEACSVLEEAANGTDPRIALHRYMALRGAGQTQQAEQLKPQIDLRALRGMLLSPLDRAALQELSR